MNKIKQILIGASILALSGNAAAMFIKVVDTEYTKWKNLVPVIENIVEGDLVTGLSEKKLGKLTTKYEKYNNKKAEGKKKKARKVKRNIKTKMTKWDIGAIAGLPAGSVSNLETIIENNGEGGDNGVPEPSTLALLGMGLVGIGAARRLRKKAR